MPMTITLANALNTLLEFVLEPTRSRGRAPARAAALLLTEHANKTLHAGYSTSRVAELWPENEMPPAFTLAVDIATQTGVDVAQEEHDHSRAKEDPRAARPGGYDPQDPDTITWIRTTAEWPGGQADEVIAVSRTWWNSLTDSERDEELASMGTELLLNNGTSAGAYTADPSTLTDAEKAQALR